MYELHKKKQLQYLQNVIETHFKTDLTKQHISIKNEKPPTENRSFPTRKTRNFPQQPKNPTHKQQQPTSTKRTYNRIICCRSERFCPATVICHRCRCRRYVRFRGLSGATRGRSPRRGAGARLVCGRAPWPGPGPRFGDSSVEFAWR